jgi:hypothetical protein
MDALCVKELLPFCDLHELEIVVRRRVGGGYCVSMCTKEMRHCVERDGTYGFQGVMGDGHTLDDAMTSLALVMRGAKLHLHALGGEDRALARTIVCPEDLEYIPGSFH